MSPNIFERPLAIHDCFGDVEAAGDATEGLVVGDIDLAQLPAWRERFPALKDRRPGIYSALEKKDGTPIKNPEWREPAPPAPRRRAGS